MNYIEFYKEVRKYATNYASGLFRNEGMKEEAVDKAMDTMEDWILNGGKADSPTAYIKTMVRNSIKKSSKDRKFEVVDIKWPGNTVYQKTSKHKPLKVRLEQIVNKKHERIVELYLDGMIQERIAEEVGFTQPRISQVLNLYF